MDLADKIHRIHNANFPPTPEAVSAIVEILADYGFECENDVPDWFSEMFDRLIARETVTLEFSEVGSDLGSVLQELKHELGWMVDDFGEGIQIDFPKSGLRVDISREHVFSDGGSGCSCTISATASSGAPAASRTRAISRDLR